ncbi:hypothetical protein L9F63_004805, partial [Diploptera punctata]
FDQLNVFKLVYDIKVVYFQFMLHFSTLFYELYPLVLCRVRGSIILFITLHLNHTEKTVHMTLSNNIHDSAYILIIKLEIVIFLKMQKKLICVFMMAYRKTVWIKYKYVK